MFVRGLLLQQKCSSSTPTRTRVESRRLWMMMLPSRTSPSATTIISHRGAACCSWNTRRHHHHHHCDRPATKHHHRGPLALVASSSSSSFSSSSSPARTTTAISNGGFDICSTVTGAVVCQRVIDLHLPEGRCVGYAVQHHNTDDPLHSLSSCLALSSPSHWIREYLHPLEIEYGMTQQSDRGRTSFLLGRLALRQALGSFMTTRMDDDDDDCTITESPSSSSSLLSVPFSSTGSSSHCILKDLHGRPHVPAGFLGTISHKRNVAVALVSKDNGSSSSTSSSSSSTTALQLPTRGIGVDLESTTPKNKLSIARKVLTPQEITDLGNVPGVSAEEEVLLRFGIKESLYKAMHPLICQYVGFQEATVQPIVISNGNGNGNGNDGVGGVVTTTLDLKSGVHKRFGKVTAHWRRLRPMMMGNGDDDKEDYFLSSCSVALRATHGPDDHDIDSDDPCRIV